MINLKTTKINFVKIFLILFIITISLNLHSLENKILFKINDNAYTTLDYKKRIAYLDFVGSNQNLTKQIIIEDLISATLFFEYYKRIKNKKNYDLDVNNIYQEILKNNNKNNKVYKNILDKENIFFNIKIDLIRKNILENLLKQEIKKINISDEEINLLYKYKIKYINLKSNEIDEIIKEIKSLNKINFNQILTFLKNKNINFFTKEKQINDLSNLDTKLKKNIKDNNNTIILEKNNEISIIFVEKEFETYDGIIAHLYSVKSKTKLDNKNLLCENLMNKENVQNIENKKYKYKDLNEELKLNLINVNDFVNFSNEEENIYVVLCDIKFDVEILNNIKINKKINYYVKIIESNFIKKYSKIFNLTKVDA